MKGRFRRQERLLLKKRSILTRICSLLLRPLQQSHQILRKVGPRLPRLTAAQRLQIIFSIDFLVEPIDQVLNQRIGLSHVLALGLVFPGKDHEFSFQITPFVFESIDVALQFLIIWAFSFGIIMPEERPFGDAPQHGSISGSGSNLAAIAVYSIKILLLLLHPLYISLSLL